MTPKNFGKVIYRWCVHGIYSVHLRNFKIEVTVLTLLDHPCLVIILNSLDIVCYIVTIIFQIPCLGAGSETDNLYMILPRYGKFGVKEMENIRDSIIFFIRYVTFRLF